MNLSTIISLREMMEIALDPQMAGKYLFHGSNVVLNPITDWLTPDSPGVNGAVRGPVCAGDIATGLRYALGRAYGTHHLSADDFACFATRQYKIVVREFIRAGWAHGLRNDQDAYLYMVPAEYFSSNENVAVATRPVPILARARVTFDSLRCAGFVLDNLSPLIQMRRIIDAPNTDDAIRIRVLPRLAYRGRGRPSR